MNSRCCFLTWRNRSFALSPWKSWLHTGQAIPFPCSCLRAWISACSLLTKSLASHLRQCHALSIRLRWRNPRVHSCARTWIRRSSVFCKTLSQIGHGIPPSEWTRWCWSRLGFRVKPSPHILKTNCFSPVPEEIWRLCLELVFLYLLRPWVETPLAVISFTDLKEAFGLTTCSNGFSPFPAEIWCLCLELFLLCLLWCWVETPLPAKSFTDLKEGIGLTTH